MSSVDAATHDVWRLFVAVDLPDDVKRRMQLIRETLEQAGWAGRWTRPESIHLTLKFFGNYPVDGVRALTDGLRSAAQDLATFRLQTSVMGAFPNERRPRVIWLGVKDGSGELSRLATSIEAESQTLGLEAEQRPFSPHLTVARVRPEDQYTITDVDRRFEELNRRDALKFDVDHITLYRSELRRSGALYTVVERVDFEAKR